MPVTPVKSIEQFREIINSDKPVVFDFWATWCGPCRVISPVFEKLSNETKGIDFYKVDIDEQAEIAEECGIRAMPTFKIYKGGKQEGEFVGAVPKGVEDLVAKSKSLL